MVGILIELPCSHRQFKDPDKPGTVTVSEPSVDVPIGTLKNIWRQARLEKADALFSCDRKGRNQLRGLYS